MNIQIELKISQKSNQHQSFGGRLHWGFNNNRFTSRMTWKSLRLHTREKHTPSLDTLPHTGQKFDLSNQRECEINFIPFCKSLKPLRFILSACLMQNSLIPQGPIRTVYSILYLIKFVHQYGIWLLLLCWKCWHSALL